MRVTRACAVCGGDAITMCSGCFSVAYCSQKCQKTHWATHKSQCSKPYSVKENPTVGR